MGKGPIYLHWMLLYGVLYGEQTGDRRWRGLATEMASRAREDALDAKLIARTLIAGRS
jgi:hypothetical protein